MALPQFGPLARFLLGQDACLPNLARFLLGSERLLTCHTVSVRTLTLCNATSRLVCAHWGCCTAACWLVSTHRGWCGATCQHVSERSLGMVQCGKMVRCNIAGAPFCASHHPFRVPRQGRAVAPTQIGDRYNLRKRNFFLQNFIKKYREKNETHQFGAKCLNFK